MCHRNVGAFFQRLDRLFFIAGLRIGHRKRAISVTFVVGFPKVLFEDVDDVFPLAELFIFLCKPNITIVLSGSDSSIWRKISMRDCIA